MNYSQETMDTGNAETEVITVSPELAEKLEDELAKVLVASAVDVIEKKKLDEAYL